MNREIKFRAWDKKIKKMYQLTGISCSPTVGAWINDESGFDNLLVDDENGYVMQYTGLKDKNGKEIYEGDIVVCVSPHDGDEDIWSDSRGIPFVISWDDKNKCFDSRGNLIYSPGNFEVIGNIYENPDLLKESL